MILGYKDTDNHAHCITRTGAPRIAPSSRSLRRPSERRLTRSCFWTAPANAGGRQILTDLREELADRLREQLGQMHVATAFGMPDALDNVEEEREEKNGVQPTHKCYWQNNAIMRLWWECQPIKVFGWLI
ncbi:uncharacterized protein LOC144092141 [Stigmatopora argus]